MKVQVVDQWTGERRSLDLVLVKKAKGTDGCANCGKAIPLNTGRPCWTCQGPLCESCAPLDPLVTAACSDHPRPTPRSR